MNQLGLLVRCVSSCNIPAVVMLHPQLATEHASLGFDAAKDAALLYRLATWSSCIRLAVNFSQTIAHDDLYALTSV